MAQLQHWILDHQGTLTAMAYAAMSEWMALNPNWKYNGILQALLATFKKKSSP